MKKRDDARAKELSNLKLALATFALQLEAFEIRAKEELFAVGKPGAPVPPSNSGRMREKDKMIGGR